MHVYKVALWLYGGWVNAATVVAHSKWRTQLGSSLGLRLSGLCGAAEHLMSALAANDDGSAAPASAACPRSFVPIRMTAAFGACPAAGVWPLRRRQSRCPVWSAAGPHVPRSRSCSECLLIPL